jgi:phospholipid/cholesterol/gamma-HCH transport system substrate-binding protein
MLTLTTKIKLITFGVLSVLVLVYTAVTYANLGRFIGLSGYYTVRMDLPSAGGLYNTADVTYRGVSVGRVGNMTLTSGGIVADLDISNSAPKIPSAGLRATVSDLSAVGEQYVNLIPQASSGPYLTAGSVIPERVTSIPLPVTTLLTNLNNLVASVPQQSLRVVVSQLGAAFQNTGPSLGTLLTSSATLSQAATANLPRATKLIDDGQTVLATQAAETSAIESFGRSASLLAGQFAASDNDLANLITNTPEAALQVSGLLQDNDVTLGAVIANLLTTSDVSLTRQAALEELLSAFPAAVAAGSTVINSKGADFGLSLSFFTPLPCTEGYNTKIYRNGLDTGPAPPLNTSATCTSPASSGIDVRGSAHAPPGGGVPPAASAASADASTSSVTVPSGTTDMSQLLALP